MAPRLHAAAGRRQRRGYVGCTNVGAQRTCDGSIEPTRGASQRSCDVKKQLLPGVTRTKFALLLLQPSSCNSSSHLQSGRVVLSHSCEASPHEGDGESRHADGRVEVSRTPSGSLDFFASTLNARPRLYGAARMANYCESSTFGQSAESAWRTHRARPGEELAVSVSCLGLCFVFMCL